MTIQLIWGFAQQAETWAQVPPRSIQTVVTSPPYLGLRDNGLAPTLYGGVATCRHTWVSGRTPAVSGVKAGVPDLCLAVARHGRHGLWIELKVGGGKLTEHQARWLVWLEEQGHRASVCHGWQEAVRLIEWYLGVPVERRTEFFD